MANDYNEGIKDGLRQAIDVLDRMRLDITWAVENFNAVELKSCWPRLSVELTTLHEATEEIAEALNDIDIDCMRENFYIDFDRIKAKARERLGELPGDNNNGE